MGITAGTVALGVGIAAAAASAYGAISSGQYQAAVARNNAKMAEQNQKYSIEAGNQQAQLQSMRSAQVQGQIRSALAADNVSVNSGSAETVQADQTASSDLDTETTLHNAFLQAYGYQTQAQSDNAQAGQDVTAGYEGAATDLLGASSSLGFKYANMQAGSGSLPIMGDSTDDSSIVSHQGGL